MTAPAVSVSDIIGFVNPTPTSGQLWSEPWRYPGERLTSSLLLGVQTGDQKASWAQLLPRRGRRMGQACVRLDEGDVPLNYALLAHNVTPMDARRPVAAFGSNADPRVLMEKFRRGAVSTVVPLTPGTLANAALTASAHVSRPGYIPAAGMYAAGGSLPVVVAWLDGEQIACLDETEPNYRPLVLRHREHKLTLLENHEELEAVTLYDTRWQVLSSLVRGELEQCAILRSVLGQSEAIRSALRLASDATEEELRAAMLRLAESEPLRQEVSEGLRVLAGEGGLRGADAAPAPSYGMLESRWPEVDPALGLRVRPTVDPLDRRGEVVACLHPDTRRDLGISTHAVLSANQHPAGGVTPHVLVRIQDDVHVPEDSAAVDQVARNALGVELFESISTAAVRPPKRRADWIFGLPVYVTCRVQPADLTTVERPVCLVDELTLGLLGIRSGDDVIVEGLLQGLDKVATLRLRAHEAPTETLDRRARLSGGTMESRFPSARDALGVYPDLPWIFLDAATRSSLGVHGKLQTVRLRASRTYQLTRELRESLLLLVLAFIGLAALIPSRVVLVLLLGAVLFMASAVVVIRLRKQLAQPRVRLE